MFRKTLLRTVAVAVLGLAALPAVAQTSFVFQLDPSQEVQTPAVVSSARGVGYATLDASNFLTLFVYHDVVGPTAAHIHGAAAGVNGPVVFSLGTPTSPIGIGMSLNPADVATLMSGGFYVNVHSAAFPSGEIRGQIVNSFPSKVFISEYCNDPLGAVVGLDCNLDGTAATSTSQADDEFVEIVNGTDQTVNIGGWTVSDGFGVRHVFAVNTLLTPGSAIVVFGGGDMTNFNNLGLAGVVASTGTLGLNNTADSITISDNLANVIDSVSWATSGPGDGDGEAIVKVPQTPLGALTFETVATPGVPSSAGYYNGNVFPYPAAILPPPIVAAYPGNGSDAAMTVAINGTVDNQMNNVHAVVAFDLVTLRYFSPNTTLTGSPILALGQLFSTGFAPIGLQLPGDPFASIYVDLGMPIAVLADGLSNPGVLFAPILAGHVVSTIIPPAFSGSGLSIMCTLICADPGRNAVNLGVADSHEIQLL